MTTYYRRNGADLPSLIGVNQDDGTRSSAGEAGFVSFGPHLYLPEGNYFGGFHIRALRQTGGAFALKLDVTSHAGETVIAEREVPGSEILCDIAGLLGLTFQLQKATEAVEVRLRVYEEVLINVRDLVIFSTTMPIG